MERWIFLCGLLGVVACGARGTTPTSHQRVDLDADPIALLPSSAVVVGNFNARAVFADTSAGAAAAAIANSLVPLGAESGFQASRDLDRVLVAAYSSTGAEVAAILSGRFDEASLAAATRGKGGIDVTRGTYAGHATYTIGSLSYAVLTARTAVCGTRDGLRRVLERVQSGAFERALSPWMVAALETKDADIAVVSDLVTQPVTAAAITSLNLAWLKEMRNARAIANFGAPGMNVAAAFGYGAPEQAQAATEGIRRADSWLRVIGPLLGGVRLQNLQTTTNGSDAQCTFAVDEHALVALLGLLPRFLPTTP